MILVQICVMVYASQPMLEKIVLWLFYIFHAFLYLKAYENKHKRMSHTHWECIRNTAQTTNVSCLFLFKIKCEVSLILDELYMYWYSFFQCIPSEIYEWTNLKLCGCTYPKISIVFNEEKTWYLLCTNRGLKVEESQKNSS